MHASMHCIARTALVRGYHAGQVTAGARGAMVLSRNGPRAEALSRQNARTTAVVDRNYGNSTDDAVDLRS